MTTPHGLTAHLRPPSPTSCRVFALLPALPNNGRQLDERVAVFRVCLPTVHTPTNSGENDSSIARRGQFRVQWLTHPTHTTPIASIPMQTGTAAICGASASHYSRMCCGPTPPRPGLNATLYRRVDGVDKVRRSEFESRARESGQKQRVR